MNEPTYINWGVDGRTVISVNSDEDTIMLVFRRYSPLFDTTVFITHNEARQLIEALTAHTNVAQAHIEPQATIQEATV